MLRVFVKPNHTCAHIKQRSGKALAFHAEAPRFRCRPVHLKKMAGKRPLTRDGGKTFLGRADNAGLDGPLV